MSRHPPSELPPSPPLRGEDGLTDEERKVWRRKDVLAAVLGVVVALAYASAVYYVIGVGS